MKDNRTMSEPETTETAQAEEKTAVTDLGKFKDVKALLEAYQALEAEFTRRSQKLKALEASKEQVATVNCEKAKSEGGKLPENGNLPEEIVPKKPSDGHADVVGGGQTVTANAQAPSTVADAYDGGGTRVTLSEMSEQMKNAVIEEYLNGVFSKRGVPFVTGGGAVSATRRTPKNMREAGALANRLFKNKEEK